VLQLELAGPIIGITSLPCLLLVRAQVLQQGEGTLQQGEGTVHQIFGGEGQAQAMLFQLADDREKGRVHGELIVGHQLLQVAWTV
jgi:hypothetical protein